MNFRKRVLRDEPEINLIPFIDVLLVILIFLMVTTTYNKYTELQISLPSAKGVKMLERPLELNIVVSEKGEYLINDQAMEYQNPAQMAEKLRAMIAAAPSGKNPVVIISADSKTPHQQVINILEAARLAGVEKLVFATQTDHSQP